MRILFVSNLYPPEVLGGYEILCANVVARLLARGHQALVLTSSGGVSGAEESTVRVAQGAIASGAPHHAVAPDETGPAGESVRRTLRLYLPFGQPPRLARRERQRVERPNRAAMAQALKDFSPDVVFVWSQLRLGLGAAREAEEQGYPVVHTMNDEHIMIFRPGERKGLSGLLRYLIEDLLLPASTWKGWRGERVLVISETVRSRLAAAAPRFAAARVTFQGIPLDRFPLKAEPGEGGDPLKLLYAGQLHPYKGVHTLLEAAAQVGKQRFEITVAGAGDPAYEQELRRLAIELGLDVRFTGRLDADAMGDLYRRSHVLAFTSIWDEPFGLTHLEAMASGTPVVSVSHGGPGEFLVHGQNALLFTKDRPDELAVQLSALLTDGELRRRLALAGRSTVEEQFTLEKYTDRLESQLREALTAASAVTPPPET